MNEQSWIAYHEAGHVLLAEHLGGRVLMVTLEPQWDDGPRRHGETTIAWNAALSGRERARMEVAVALAGPVAELLYRDEIPASEMLQAWSADWSVAQKNLRQLSPAATDTQILHLASEVLGALREWFSAPAVWDCLAQLATELEAHETLEEDLLEELRAAQRLQVNQRFA